MKRRVLSLVITLALCLNLCPVWVLAAEGDSGLCPHHPAHTDECGYLPPVLGQECTHNHDDNCSSAEAGCLHKHDAVCGYVLESPGAPCGFVCRICPIEDLIGELPHSVSVHNSERVRAQIEEIYALYDELTEDECQLVDLSPCVSLWEQADMLNDAAQNDKYNYILSENETFTSPHVVSGLTIINTKEFTLFGTGSSAIQVTENGDLELIGKVDSKAVGVEVLTGGTLRVTEPGTDVHSGSYALDIASGVTVQLSAGRYYGKIAAIQAADENFSDFLAPGCAYFDENGSPILPADMALARTVVVGECTDHGGKSYAHTPGTTEHTWTCPACGTEETEVCTFDFQDKDGTCGLCGNTLTVEVDEDDLTNLVYDGTIQPEDVKITVTLTDGSNKTLVKGTDYEVKYEPRKDAGEIRVTVTGITFNGTFTKTYTVDPDRPALVWDTSVKPAPVEVDYDGEPVEASTPAQTGDLPSVKINILSTEDNLQQYLQYSYKKQGDAGYTDGLPTNAGTYDVIVSLPEMQNFEAAVSAPITLTINQISPIVTAPKAAKPVYNGTAQNLVTAGTLDPAAKRDGLEIQFSENENGPYSTAIPTGTNAGTGYRVWYKVVGLTGNYVEPNPNPAEVSDVAIQRKPITPVVELSQTKYQYDGDWKEPAVTVKDGDTVLPTSEYSVTYENNRDVSTADKPAKVIVADKTGGNYDITAVTVTFQITLREQAALSITGQPRTVIYGDQFTLGTSGGSGNGLVTWEVIDVDGVTVAAVGQDSGQVTIVGDGKATVKATKSGKDPVTGLTNYADATATWTLEASKKSVTAIVTAEDKDYDGKMTATVHADVKEGVLPGDVIDIQGLTGTFDDENAGVDKTVTVNITGANITGKNSEHYAVSYSSTTVKATIHKAVAKITTPPVAATLTYNGNEQELIATGAVVNTTGVVVEYALSEDGPYSIGFPEGTNAGEYTVWYRIQETDNYTGEAPQSVKAEIAKKPVNPTIELSGEGLTVEPDGTYSYVYDGNAKEPVVTLTEADGTTVIPTSEYTVSYSNNINVGTATVTVIAKPDGNYSFTDVTKDFTIEKEKAKVTTAPEAAGEPLVFNTRAQKLVTAGSGTGGTMVYSVDGENGTYLPTIPTKTDAGDYTVHYKVKGDANHSDSDVGSVVVTIAPKTVKDPTITLFDENGDPLVSYTYDGSAKEPQVTVVDGSTPIDAGEYEIRYENNTDAGNTATVNIIDKPNGNYTVTGSMTFVIEKADIVFAPAPTAAVITYDGKPHELLVPGTTSGGEVLYALNSATSRYDAAIPQATEAGDYTVYYKVVGDKNHNDFTVQSVPVTIQRKPLTNITIELTPDSFEYDGKVKMPTVTVKFTEGKIETVVPGTEYDWTCDNAAPTNQGTYTITITDEAGGNYDLTGVTANTATFSIGKTAQAPLVIEGKPTATIYGDTFTLTTSGGSSSSAVTWSATGPATVDAATGEVKITGVGTVTVTATNPGDTNYLPVSGQWTFTAEPKPVAASIVVGNRDYDGTTDAAVTSASIATINGDTVNIEPASITAAFDTPGVGTGKTVTLDTSKVQVTGADAAKYNISYPNTVTADVAQANTTITTNPAKIDPLTYNGQPQALVTAGVSDVGFLVYSLDGTSFSPNIPTGTDAGTYTVYYKVDGTADYTGVAVNTTPVSVTIAPKTITPKVEPSEFSFLYDGTKKEPELTVLDGKTVIDPDQYTVTWTNNDPAVTDGLLTAAGTYTATIENVPNGNYSFTAAATAEIVPAEQAAIEITGAPEHVCYGDRITTLGTSGGTGEGMVKWSVTAGGASAEIDEDSGVLTIKGTGSVTVKAERTVPNYGPVSAVWTFTVEPKPVLAEVTVTGKVYDGTTAVADADIAVKVKTSDLVDSVNDVITITAKGAYDNANVGTGKTVTLSNVNVTADATKYSVAYPATAKGDITPRKVDVTVTLSGNDLKQETSGGYYYDYDGTEKTPNVTVTANDDNAVLAASDYSVSITGNKNAGDATVTVTANAGGNYTFNDAEVKFAIKEAGAVLTKDPAAKNLTYTGQPQDLVDVGTATGGTVVYSDTDKDDLDSYSETIPQGTNAGTYTVYYMVKGDANHADTAPGQVSVTIKPKEITPAITLNPTSFVYDGTAKTPAVTVEDSGQVIDGPGTANPEYSVSYRDNVNAGTATVTVSDNNGGNYIVNGTATFEITKKAPTVTAPTEIAGLQYNGERQDLVKAGVTNDGTVYYSVNGGNYTSAVPSELAVGTYTIAWKVLGDGNHSDTEPATLTVSIGKNQVKTPGISLSPDQFTFNNSQQKPVITVSDDSGRLIPEREYTVTITGTKSNNMVDVDTYTVTITTPPTSNYDMTNDGTVNVRTFKIVPADQESISITGTQSQVRYGDDIQLGVTGGTGAGTVSWTVAAKDGSAIDSEISPTGLLTVRDVGGPLVVTVTRTRSNYGAVSAEWEFSVSKKPVTAVLTGVDRPYAAGDKTVAVTAAIPDSDLVAGDAIIIDDLTGTFDTDSVGTAKKVTVDRSNPNISGDNSDKYAVTIPETTTASILAGAATVDTDPTPNTLTYDASKAQELVTAGTATGGTMVYSLDGTNFTAAIPKAKDAGTYTVYYKAQGDGNHTDSTVKSVQVTIGQQTVTPQIELTPPSAQYDGNVKRPEVVVRDADNNVIPKSEYKVTYVDDSGENWTNQGRYTVKVENITGGNYVVETATADFVISTSAQAPLEIVNKPGLVHYGDTFTLSAVGGSGNSAVTWSSSDDTIAHIDGNGFVTIKGVGPATITATKPGGSNYDTVTAEYPLNALQKPITAIVTAKDRVYKDGDVSAELIISWKPGDLVDNDTIDTSSVMGKFENDSAGTGKTVNIKGNPVNDATAQKYAITIPPTTTASILKADATAPTLTANDRVYDGAAQVLVGGGGANTLYSDTRDGVYTAAVPTEVNAGTYTVWYKEKGDANHNDSQPQAIQVTISQKTLTVDATNTTLSGNDLQTDADGTYYYKYDGSEKKPSVIIKDGSAVIPASEYAVGYSNNKNVSTTDKKATVTITSSDGGNYIVDGSVTFEIRKGGAELVSSPQPVRGLTYTGQPQELVTGGTATGGHIEYALDGGAWSEDIPKADNAGTYTVTYRVIGDGNHEDGTKEGSVTVTISPKEVISPIITVSGSYDYDGSAQEPGAANVKVEDGATLIPGTEYTLSYRDNVNAGTATVIIINANGGNYIVNGTGTFEITKGTASVATAPKGLENLPYNGTEQALIEAGAASNGTMVYSLSETGEYTPAIPTGKAVDTYTVWYKAQGDSNHSDSEAQSITASIIKNTVTKPTVQLTPPSVTFNGEKQEPTVTVKDDNGFVIDGSEYTVAYLDENNNSDLIQAGTYALTITSTGSNYDFTGAVIDEVFKIIPAGQTPLTITGTRERVRYGDIIQLGTTGGNGTITWTVSDSNIAEITNGLLTVKGIGSVTVTATSTKTGYADQTATWSFYAEKKQVTAVVTAADRAYNGDTDATLTVTISSGLVSGDSITGAQAEGHFTDKNVGENKTVIIDSLTFPDDINVKYEIVTPVTTTAAIFKANVDEAKVTAPTAKTGLEYTGLAQVLVSEGSSPDGIMEYSLDGKTYSASLPTGTDADDYEVWYRVKGDGNHNDTGGTKLASNVTIAPQTVNSPTVEFNPTGATYDGQEHKPSVILKDAHGRVIPAAEYTVDYGSTSWKDVGDHTATITGKPDGNYSIIGTPSKTFTILPAGQSPLSIVGQPGEVWYGSVFTLSTNGGSGTGAVTWETSDNTVAFINSQTGRVEIRKAGGPVTITARKAAGGGYGEMMATWTFSAEKRPATAIVTARNKPYNGDAAATLDISWKDGGLINGDTITLNLTGTFDDANVGADKIVRITLNGDLPDGGGKYAVTYNNTTTASITAQAATVSGVNAGPWTYNGSEQPLLSGGTATNGTIVYSRNGVDFMENVPTEINAGKYTVYYKARGNTNYADSDVRMVEVTIQPKTVTNPTIELSSDSLEYDGTAKEPEVTAVKEGSTVIPSGEYTVSYSNNVNVGTTAKVTITDVSGGNYTVSGSRNFTITAAAPALTAEPQPKDLTYTGKPQALVTAGTAVNGKVMYSLDGGEYGTAIPRATDAGDYEVAYKVVDENGKDATTEEYVYVTIAPKQVTPIIRLENRSSYSVAYNGKAQEPDVTVYVESKLYTGFYDVDYANNINVGTAEVTVQSMGGNYQFLAFKTFEITKGKAEFLSEPTARTTLVYNGTAQKLVNVGYAKNSGVVLYSLDNSAYTTTVPTGINRDSYTVFAKVQGSSNYEESDVVVIPVEIGVNTVKDPNVSLSSSSFPYTGSEVKPTVTVSDDDGNVISADEYTVTYSNNVNVGTATINIRSKTAGNYSFTASTTFTILDAGQIPLTITGKQDTVYYGDTLHLGTTGGSGNGAVTWEATGPVDRLGDGQYKITKSGSVTITATKAASGNYAASTDTWTFYAKPKPVTAIVTAASKPYDGKNTATLTVTINRSDLVGTDTFTVTAEGHFTETSVGENRTVIIDDLTIPDGVSEKYDISWSATTTASITPKPASATKEPALQTASLTYNGSPQPLLANGGEAEGGTIVYSVDDGVSYSRNAIATDAGNYDVWYKVVAGDENHKDSAPVNLGTVTIMANTNTPTVLCTPSSVPYDGKEKTPNVEVWVDDRIVPKDEYTAVFEEGRTKVGTYKVTVTDKPGGNYEFTGSVEGSFKIVADGQNPPSIITDKAVVYYGDTFRLSAMGGSGNGPIQWEIKEGADVAAVDQDTGVVTVNGVGKFVVEAYYGAVDGYSESGRSSVALVADPKVVTPVVLIAPKYYDGSTNVATSAIKATVKLRDLVEGDSITIAGLTATYDSVNAGTNKIVMLDYSKVAVTGTNSGRYVIDWPDSVTGTIDKAKVELDTRPAASDLTYDGSAHPLVTGGTTVNGIGTIKYSLDQNSGYSENIPTGTNAGTYTVWYKVEDDVNFTGIPAASVEVEIKKATPKITTYPTASGTAGQLLSDIKLNGGAIEGNVTGKFAWEDGSVEAVNGTSYNVIFTPDPAYTANYNTATIQVQVTVTSSTPSGGGSSSSSNPTKTTVQNGTASTVVSAADGRKLVRQAAANQSGSIVIKPEITGDVNKSEVSIPASTVSQIEKETSAALTVSAPIADVTIPQSAMDTLSREGGTVKVVTEQVEQGIALTLTAGGKAVENVPGGVTLAVPAADAGPGTVAVLVHEDGTRETIRKSVVENGAVSIPLSGSATVEIVDNSKRFADVADTDWSSDAVAFASAHELFSGTSETTFSPDQAMSRGMLATVLYNLEGRPDQALTGGYSDVSSDAWYAGGVAWAAENGIASGYGDGQFGPDDSITREQFVVMLWKYAGSPKADSQSLDFTDADRANGYAKEALCWAVEQGILSGYTDGQLLPSGMATRAQAAQMLKNFMESSGQ